MPAMGGIAKRAEVGIVRRDDQHLAAAADQPVKFLHAADHVGKMLDHVHGLQPVESRIAKRIRKTVQIRDYVRPRRRIAVDAYGPCFLIDPAAYVQYSHANRRL